MVDDDGAVGLPSVCLSMVISQTHTCKCKSRQTFPPPVWSDPVTVHTVSDAVLCAVCGCVSSDHNSISSSKVPESCSTWNSEICDSLCRQHPTHHSVRSCNFIASPWAYLGPLWSANFR